ncbi:TPA: hypothetical protein HA244_00510 [Candidatus Micrarchaeota archaeon]|nr:hypothetical protein [Candidatus Micrarchaeota archaeon]
MAKPIEPTPEITGKDADEFVELTKRAEVTLDPQKTKFLDECRKIYAERKP